ncbi:MAG: hypothetical protein EGP09_00925 [SAR202 cluster bacterium]|nr:MAG: hypothetical protein EGP09_00925 [SAR202 cluster bacterium]
MNVSQVRKEFGKCLELVSMDPNFHEISVGLFVKKNILTVWSYSKKEGIEDRLNQIRDKMVDFGALERSDSDFKLVIPEGALIERPLKFLFVKSVEMKPDSKPETGVIQAKDNKSKLTFIIEGSNVDGKYIYKVSASGEHDKPNLRIRAVVGGFIKYGECVKNDNESFIFPDAKSHDEYVRILLPYARNVSAVENMLNANEQAGQMTTQTLGFSQ